MAKIFLITLYFIILMQWSFYYFTKAKNRIDIALPSRFYLAPSTRAVLRRWYLNLRWNFVSWTCVLNFIPTTTVSTCCIYLIIILQTNGMLNRLGNPKSSLCIANNILCYPLCTSSNWNINLSILHLRCCICKEYINNMGSCSWTGRGCFQTNHSNSFWNNSSVT